MPIEVVTFISDLNPTNPVGSTDKVQTLDDHVRNIKSALLNTFPNITGAVTLTQGQINTVANAAIKNALNVFSAVNQFGPTALQSTALIGSRNSPQGNSFEWGHPNAAGFVNVLGFEAGGGRGFVGFHVEAGTNASTYRTRGVPGVVFRADAAGGYLLGRVPTASADNQTITADLTVSPGGGTLGIAPAVNVTGLSLDIANNAGGLLRLHDSDAGVGLKRYRIRSLNGQMQFVSEDDAGTQVAVFMTATKDAASLVATLALAAGVITLNGVDVADYARKTPAQTFAGDLTLASIAPQLIYRETDQAADESDWRVRASNKAWRVSATNAAFSIERNIISAARLGVGPAITAIDIGNTTDLPPINLYGVVALNGVPALDYARLSTDNAFVRSGAPNNQTIGTIGAHTARLLLNANGANVAQIAGIGAADGIIAGTVPGDVVLYAASGRLVFGANSGSRIYFALSQTGTVATPNLDAAEVGFKGWPPSAVTGASGTLTLVDAGRLVTIVANPEVPANATVPYPIGTELAFYNGTGASRTITFAGGDTLGGSNAVADNSVGVIMKVLSTRWVRR